MIKIDLLITKGNEKIKLSDLGLLIHDVEADSPSLDVDFRSVRGRNGRIFSGAQFISKSIKVTGTFVVSSLLLYEQLKDRLNALIVDSNPYFITKMIPVSDDLYGYEMPGQTTEDLDLLGVKHEAYHYRYKVVSPDGIEANFQGKYEGGLLFKFSVDFITAELPFGETIPKTVVVNGNSIPYKGTAVNSQLEYPWFLKLTAAAEQSGTFTVKIQNRTFKYSSQTKIVAGDVFILKGIETTKNSKNVNNYTNYEHLELQPTISNANSFETTFNGKIELVNFIEFYK